MPELHDLLAAEAERQQPAAIPPFDGVLARAHRRRRMRYAMAVGATAVVVVVGATAIGLAVAGGGHRSLDAIRPAPLVGSGQCAGLTVSITFPGRAGVWPVSGGDRNVVTMPTGALMYVHAQGPCRRQLRIAATNSLLQTADGAPESVNAEGIGVIVSHGKPGNGTIALSLDCAPDRHCPASPPSVATVTVKITGRASPDVTGSPSPSPFDTHSRCHAVVRDDKLAAPFWLDNEHFDPATSQPLHTRTQVLRHYRHDPGLGGLRTGRVVVAFATYSRVDIVTRPQSVWIVVSYGITAHPSLGPAVRTDETVIYRDVGLRPVAIIQALPSRCS